MTGEGRKSEPPPFIISWDRDMSNYVGLPPDKGKYARIP